MIYVKTELGKTALQDRSLGLTPKQRSSFIMFDGKRSVEDILKLTLLLGVTADDLSRLVALGLIAPIGVDAVSSASSEPQSPAQASFVQTVATPPAPTVAINDRSQYAKAYPIAVKLTSNLGLRGFRLNLSVESAGDLEALKDLAPKIKEAVGVEKFRELEDALYR